ncbi:hypothetical protein ACFXDH_38320 [Streptomyces sp. NPDC059467]|uniref:hypothetical protein n=1 Tax=Streptomyces sp. NPDC059467 TaxID=3346844 RepID=UPI0036CD50F1
MLRFPDTARLELDRAVQDLLDRAGEVLRTQGRLRNLLHAVLAVTADVTSPSGLDHLLTAACGLLHARFGGLAVFHATGDLAEFLQMGTGPATSEGIKRCGPEDEGVLRQLADGRQPRIAQSLRDRVIEEIFAVSLTLNKVAGTAPGDLRQQVLKAISHLDTVIKNIRATVFDLQHHNQAQPGRSPQVTRPPVEQEADGRPPGASGKE